jgi:hypothetical protein
MCCTCYSQKYCTNDSFCCKTEDGSSAAGKQNDLHRVPLIAQTNTYWLGSIHPCPSYETIKTGAKRKKLPDQTTFGGEAMSLKLSNIDNEVKATKLSTCKVATVLSRMTSFFMPPPNMTFYVNMLHENSQSRLLQASATFYLPNKTHRQASPCKIEC